MSRRGHIASISLRNTRGIDILATNREASRFYVFVALGGVLERPGYHIVPSSGVAEHTSTSHREW